MWFVHFVPGFGSSFPSRYLLNRCNSIWASGLRQSFVLRASSRCRIVCSRLKSFLLISTEEGGLVFRYCRLVCLSARSLKSYEQILPNFLFLRGRTSPKEWPIEFCSQSGSRVSASGLLSEIRRPGMFMEDSLFTVVIPVDSDSVSVRWGCALCTLPSLLWFYVNPFVMQNSHCCFIVQYFIPASFEGVCCFAASIICKL